MSSSSDFSKDGAWKQKKNEEEFLTVEMVGNSFSYYCVFRWLWRYSLGLMSWVRRKT